MCRSTQWVDVVEFAKYRYIGIDILYTYIYGSILTYTVPEVTEIDR